MIRLLLVEHRPSLCQGLHLLFAIAKDIEVVGVTADCCAALDAARTLHPDVVIVDADTTPIDYRAVGALAEIRADAALIILTLGNARTSQLAEHVSASALVMKSMPAEMLLNSVREVCRG